MKIIEQHFIDVAKVLVVYILLVILSLMFSLLLEYDCNSTTVCETLLLK